MIVDGNGSPWHLWRASWRSSPDTVEGWWLCDVLIGALRGGEIRRSEKSADGALASGRGGAPVPVGLGRGQALWRARPADLARLRVRRVGKACARGAT
jgi:hypothetical protein